MNCLYTRSIRIFNQFYKSTLSFSLSEHVASIVHTTLEQRLGIINSIALTYFVVVRRHQLSKFLNYFPQIISYRESEARRARKSPPQRRNGVQTDWKLLWPSKSCLKRPLIWIAIVRKQCGSSWTGLANEDINEGLLVVMACDVFYCDSILRTSFNNDVAGKVAMHSLHTKREINRDADSFLLFNISLNAIDASLENWDVVGDNIDELNSWIQWLSSYHLRIPSPKSSRVSHGWRLKKFFICPEPPSISQCLWPVGSRGKWFYGIPFYGPGIRANTRTRSWYFPGLHLPE